ncbi:response regulator [Alsobacter sp. R-9]
MTVNGRLRILLVEDEPLIAMTLADLLDELGHEVVEAGTAAAALGHFQADPHLDVLMTDIGLPDMPGDRLVELCRERRPDLPVVFATGHMRALPGQEERAEPPTVRVTKPFQLDDLAAALRRLGFG